MDIDEPGRPLVFSFGRPINQSHLQDLRAATKAALGVYPYTVSMNGQDLPEIDAYVLLTRYHRSLPERYLVHERCNMWANRVSRYGGGSGTLNGSSYVTHLAQEEVKTWKGWASAGK